MEEFFFNFNRGRFCKIFDVVIFCIIIYLSVLVDDK